jgi:hypothetical protein
MDAVLTDRDDCCFSAHPRLGQCSVRADFAYCKCLSVKVEIVVLMG